MREQTEAQIKGISEILKSTTNEMIKFLTEKNVDVEFDRIIEYDIKITTLLPRLELGTREHVKINLSNETRQGSSTSVAQDAAELTRLPKLELIKFDGKPLGLHRFWAQYESAVQLRPDMSKEPKFNDLLASLTGKAAAAIEGLRGELSLSD